MQRSRQAEHHAVVVIADHHNDGTGPVQGVDDEAEVLADPGRVEIRAQRVVHPRDDHRHVGAGGK